MAETEPAAVVDVTGVTVPLVVPVLAVLLVPLVVRVLPVVLVPPVPPVVKGLVVAPAAADFGAVVGGGSDNPFSLGSVVNGGADNGARSPTTLSNMSWRECCGRGEVRPRA
ncbi:MAG: hypothetical protein ACAI38_18185 [Myxococcota bacterium]|nr:hypothetical protein [Myxococcota bacterium]